MKIQHFKMFTFSGGGSKEIDDNSLVFRLFTRTTVALFLFVGAFIALTTVIHDPIDCWSKDKNAKLNSEDKSLFENYCWTNASQKVDKEEGFCVKVSNLNCTLNILLIVFPKKGKSKRL